MNQQPLFHEDFEGALSTCVAALGGAKTVGVMLRPEYEKDPDKASRWLLACLNASRDEKLSWDQTFKILLEAKAVGWGDGILPQRLMLAVSIVALPILFLASVVSVSALMKTIRGTRE